MAGYSGNWNGAPTSTGGDRGGGNSASPYMNNGMFRGRYEGPNTSIAVRTGKNIGPSPFRSASPFMQGGVFRGKFEGPFSAPGIQRQGGVPGMGASMGGGGNIAPAAGPVMGRPVPRALPPMMQPPAAPPFQLTKSMMPGLFGGVQTPPAPQYDFYSALRSAIPPGTMSFGPFNPPPTPINKIIGGYGSPGYNGDRALGYGGTLNGPLSGRTGGGFGGGGGSGW